MKKTLVIGSAVCDILIPVDHLPARSEDINLYSQKMSLGGCAFNVCYMLRLFNVPFIPFLPVGGGIYGRFVADGLRERGIESACPRSDMENGCCYCLVEPDGERTFLCYHGAEYLFKEEWFAGLEASGEASKAGSVYVCGLELEEASGGVILDFLERHPEYRIFFAPSARICSIPRSRMERILKLGPALHLNEDEAVRFTGCNDARRAGFSLMERTGNTVIVTCGSRGSLVFDAEGGTCVRVEPYTSSGGGDAVGAGDSHIGSVIALLEMGYGIADAVRCANSIASAVTEAEGALLSLDSFLAAARRGGLNMRRLINYK